MLVYDAEKKYHNNNTRQSVKTRSLTILCYDYTTCVAISKLYMKYSNYRLNIRYLKYLCGKQKQGQYCDILEQNLDVLDIDYVKTKGEAKRTWRSFTVSLGHFFTCPSR